MIVILPLTWIYNSYITLDWGIPWIYTNRSSITFNNTFLILDLQSRIKNVLLKVILLSASSYPRCAQLRVI